jgi:hypothetical protein
MPIDYHDLTSITDTLKTVYGEGITNQFNDETLTYHQFSKSERSPKGLGYEFSIRYDRAQGVGARGESQKLPDPLVGKFDKGTISPRYIYGTLRMTGPAIEAAKGDVAAFVDGLADSVDDIYQSLVVDLNRQCWGDSHGLLATLSAASDTVTTTASGATWTITCNNDAGVDYLFPGMVVDFHESGTLDVSTSASRIYSVDYAAKTAEMEPNTGIYNPNHPIANYASSIATTAVTSGATVVRIGARDASWTSADTPVEIMGLNGIFDDTTLLTTFENINASTYPQWQANVLGNSGVNRELSLDLMLQALDLLRTRAGQKARLIRCGLGQRRKYANLLLPDVRFQPGVLKGGYETLTFAGGDGSVEMVIDPVAQKNKMFFEPKGTIQKYEMTPIGWGNLDQQMHQRAGYDEWDQFLRIYTQLGTEQRNNLVLVKDLVEPNLYT